MSEIKAGSQENEAHYDEFWRWYPLDDPQQWPQWEILKRYMSPKTNLLEIGSGLRPKLPIEGSYFADISFYILEKLHQKGARAVQANANQGIPFRSESFDAICVFEVLEHLDADTLQSALTDFTRALKPQGRLFVSFPLHQKMFNDYDRRVGHTKRFEVTEVEPFFKSSGLMIEEYAAQDVPWPSAGSVRGLVFLAKYMPWVIPITTKLLDSLPSSAVRKPLNLKPWNFDSAQEDLARVSTGFFVLRKE